MPGEHRITLQTEVVYRVAEGIALVFTHSAHLVLSCLQIVENLGVIIKLGIDWQRLYRHTYGMQKTLVGATVVDGGEQRFLFIIIFSQQETIGRCKEIALEDAFLLTESIHYSHLYVECSHQTCF